MSNIFTDVTLSIMKMIYRSKCRSRIYNVEIHVFGEASDVRRFVHDNTFINDLYGIKYHDFNSPVAIYPRARASRVCVGMQSPEKPFGLAFLKTK